MPKDDVVGWYKTKWYIYTVFCKNCGREASISIPLGIKASDHLNSLSECPNCRCSAFPSHKEET